MTAKLNGALHASRTQLDKTVFRYMRHHEEEATKPRELSLPCANSPDTPSTQQNDATVLPLRQVPEPAGRDPRIRDQHAHQRPALARKAALAADTRSMRPCQHHRYLHTLLQSIIDYIDPARKGGCGQQNRLRKSRSLTIS